MCFEILFRMTNANINPYALATRVPAFKILLKNKAKIWGKMKAGELDKPHQL